MSRHRPDLIESSVYHHCIMVSIYIILPLISLFSSVTETLGSESCNTRLGLENGKINDSALTASSSYDPTTVGPANARLHSEKHGGAWCPKGPISPEKDDEYFQIDLGDTHVINEVLTQGRFANGQGQEYARAYRLHYWRKGMEGFKEYRDSLGRTILPGNKNTYTVANNSLNPPILAAKLRILPHSNHSRTVCLRVGLRGCQFTGPDMNAKVDSLELNVQSLNESMQTLETTMLSVLEWMKTTQSASNKQETKILGDILAEISLMRTEMKWSDMTQMSLMRSEMDQMMETMEKMISKVENLTISHLPTTTTPPTTTTTTTTTTKPTPPPTLPPQPSVCTSYYNITDSWRHIDYENRGAFPYHCDQTGYASTFTDLGWGSWFRFSGAAGTKLPTAPAPFAWNSYNYRKYGITSSQRICGTNAVAWLRGDNPSLKDGIVSRDVCFEWGKSNCYDSTTVKVAKCKDMRGDYFVYQLQRAPSCDLAYCALD